MRCMADIATISLGYVMLADREARMMATQEQLTAIVAAAREGNADEVVRLLDAQPDLLEANSTVTEYSLLCETSMAGHMDIARVVLERGANVNREDRYGGTALFKAIVHGHEEMATLLLGAGADVRHRINPTGLTPLMAASLQGFLGMTRLLLRHMRGAGLDDTNGDGRTALWFSCTFRRTEVLRALLLAGADCTIADQWGRPPQEAALNAIQQVPGQDGATCLDVFEWWEGELERAYALHRARRVHEDNTTQQQVPGASVSLYLRERVERGEAMPDLELRGLAEGSSEEEAEREAMLKYVIQGLGPELYVELWAGFHK